MDISPVDSLSLYPGVDEPNNSCCSISTSHRSDVGLLLPLDFSPTPYSVVCGRGRMPAEAIGNRRLNVIAQLHVHRYAMASRKDEKSLIVTQIVRIIQHACVNPDYAFVRYVNGRWWHVENLNAREKVGTVLRDLLASKYRSSTKSKLAKRKELRLEGERSTPKNSRVMKVPHTVSIHTPHTGY